jgi:hypothetical protein
VKVGVVSLLTPSLVEVPVSLLVDSASVGAAGASVSKVMLGVEPAPPPLPAASVYAPEATVIDATPPLVSPEGVNVAVRVVPVPEIALMVPPLTVISE